REELDPRGARARLLPLGPLPRGVGRVPGRRRPPSGQRLRPFLPRPLVREDRPPPRGAPPPGAGGVAAPGSRGLPHLQGPPARRIGRLGHQAERPHPPSGLRLAPTPLRYTSTASAGIGSLQEHG